VGVENTPTFLKNKNMNKNNIIVAKGTFWAARADGKRIGFESLEEAQNYLAECCGVDCCSGLLRMKSPNGTPFTLKFNNDGTIVVTNEKTNDTFNYVPE